MTTLAIIHTSPATLELLKAQAAELLPGVDVVNFLDDSILPQLRRNGGDISAVEGRFVHYARFAEQVGADAILSACSSIGELAPRARDVISVPVIRIDDAMAEAAVQSGQRIGVAATLPTTLAPTTRLLQAKAEAQGKDVEIRPVLVAGAYDRLMAGDKDAHDSLLVEALTALAAEVDVVVLAQASMARVLPRVPEALRGKFLTSPRLGLLAVRKVLAPTLEKTP
jgi:Asp/Glu/hydantoin racemase